MFHYIKAENYFKIKCLSDKRTLVDFKLLAKQEGKCDICGQAIWKLADTGLCFSCTTGESDNSDDYEIY